MATTTNLGRVQGAGFFGSTSTSTTSVATSTVQTNGITPLVGDTIVNASGDLLRITALTSSAYTVTKYGSIKGATGATGAAGSGGDIQLVTQTRDSFAPAATTTHGQWYPTGLPGGIPTSGTAIIIFSGVLSQSYNATDSLKFNGTMVLPMTTDDNSKTMNVAAVRSYGGSVITYDLKIKFSAYHSGSYLIPSFDSDTALPFAPVSSYSWCSFTVLFI